MSTCRYCGEPQIFDDHTCKKEIKPVALCDHGILNWYDMECTNMRHDLYTADQLKAAKIEVLREAASKTFCNDDRYMLLGMAVELERK